MNEVPKQTNPWYKHWWGVLIAICIWPFFLLWFLWSRSKSNLILKLGGTIGVITLLVGGVIALSSTTPTPTPKASSKPATKNVAQTPTVPIATLNTESMPILTAATNYYSQLMTTGQADAAQSNAANASSAFHQFYEKQTTVADMTGTTAYNKASNLYFDGHQTAPNAISNWNDDSQQLYSDITSWSQDEYALVVDQLMGNATAGDQTKVTTDLQTYQSDLAKTKADISQL